MDDQRDYAEEAANLRLMHEECEGCEGCTPPDPHGPAREIWDELALSYEYGDFE